MSRYFSYETVYFFLFRFNRNRNLKDMKDSSIRSDYWFRHLLSYTKYH